MLNTPFHCEIDSSRVGVRTNVRPVKSMVMCVKSPYASPLTNYWLEQKILKLYTAYYKKVIKESGGQFCEEYSKTPKNPIYTTFCGGDTNK